MKHRHVARLTTLALASALAASTAWAASHTKQSLVSTGKDPDARGRASAVVRGSNGRLRVAARRLQHAATFEVIVDGVRIGTLATGRTGSGKARFDTRPHGGDQLLGVDPHGKLLQVRDAEGDDVLEGMMPDDAEPGTIRCCIADDDETECESETPAECEAKGGVSMGEGSCMPNPCASTGDHIRCCIPEGDEDGPECEDLTAAECSAEGGVSIGPGEDCEDHACRPTPPGEEEIRCCIADHQVEDEERHGGDGDDDGEDGDHDEGEHEAECEHITASACAALGGSNLGAGSCEPDPCVASPSGAFLGVTTDVP